MKTAIALDSLLFRDDSVFLLELILNLFPDSEIYTIAHKQGSIAGPIATRPIVSSFLTHRAKDANVFRKNFWMLPSAVKAIPLHPSIEKIIIISRGHIHGMNLPAHVKRYLYIADWDLVDQSSLGWQKIFAPYVNDRREKALSRFSNIAVSSETLKKRLELPNADVIHPTFRTEEYFFIMDVEHNFNFTYHLLYSKGISKDEFRILVGFLLSRNETVKIIGPDENFKNLFPPNPNLEFLGDIDENTSAKFSQHAKAVWDLSGGFFPSKAFGALCTGRPVVVRENSINREFLTSGAHFLNEVSDMARVLKEVDEIYLSVDRKALRRAGLRWNERLFKSRMVKFMDRSLS